MARIDSLPELEWLDGREGQAEVSGARLRMTAPPESDWFNDPMGPTRNASAPALVFEPEGDFQLSARVAVEFAADFDAAVLLVHGTNDDYAKLCFEYSPDHLPTVVTVVTRGVSDDANGPTVDTSTVWLRVARIDSVYAFHHSTDGRHWTLSRLFALRRDVGSTSVGFLAQSPTGDACSATFDDIAYNNDTLADIRDGS